MIKNIVNGKVYIGSAICLADRLSNHFHLLNNNKHHSIHLQNAWNQNNNYFICGVIELVQEKEMLKEIEQKYIDKYNSANAKYGYNICPIAKNSLGCKQQRGHLEKSKRMRGRNNHFFNKKHTLEALRLISENNVRKILNNNDITEIKYLWECKAFNQTELAKIFHVGQPHISKIVNNKKRTKIYQPCQDHNVND